MKLPIKLSAYKTWNSVILEIFRTIKIWKSCIRNGYNQSLYHTGNNKTEWIPNEVSREVSIETRLDKKLIINFITC